LASASSDRDEIDVQELEDLARNDPANIEDVRWHGLKIGTRYNLVQVGMGEGRRVLLLADGYPINFYSANSVPNESIDPILALLLLCGLHVASQGRRLGTGIRVRPVDTLVQKEALIEEQKGLYGL
jgi:S-adenosylhomocysteine hydrolase